jgi:hypothetical protein
MSGISDGDPLRKSVNGAADQPDIIAMHSNGQDLQSAPGRRLYHPPSVAIVDANHCRTAWRNQCIE